MSQVFNALCGGLNEERDSQICSLMVFSLQANVGIFSKERLCVEVTNRLYKVRLFAQNFSVISVPTRERIGWNLEFCLALNDLCNIYE